MPAQKKYHYDKKTAGKIREWVGNGVSKTKIASLLGMSKTSLYEVYGKDMFEVMVEKDSEIGAKARELAALGDEKMLRLYLTTQAGWSETSKIDLDTNADNRDDSNTAIEELMTLVGKKRQERGLEEDE